MSRPLRICFLTYRGNPQCGGQGIYTRHLTKALADLGHEVEVWSGPPYPELDEPVRLRRIPSLDLWNEEQFFRRPSFNEMLDPVHRVEWLNTVTGGFPEPHTFSRRVAREYSRLAPEERFDVVHDNQCLGDGLLRLQKMVPVVATIHHPITVDRDIALAAARTRVKRWGLRRWYSFLDKQLRVARKIERVITVSEAAAEGIERDFGLPRDAMCVVPNGVDLDLFKPLQGFERAEKQLLSTISATNAPLKGFRYLIDAVALLRKKHPDLTLTVIGKGGGHPESRKRIRKLGLEDAIEFTGRLSTEEMVRRYAQATLAVVPSLYEGFGLPAIEAMACEVPVVSTAAGALPEVVGEDGVAGRLVPPAQGESLAAAIDELLASPEKRAAMGAQGRRRVTDLYTWRRAAELCVDVYREVLPAPMSIAVAEVAAVEEGVAAC